MSRTEVTPTDADPAPALAVHYSRIAPSPHQKRRSADHELSDLSHSLFHHGFINAPTVRLPSAVTRARYPDAEYELETGHRRVEAVRLLDRLDLVRERNAASKVSTLIPVTLITEDDSMKSPEAAMRTLTENVQRKPLTPYEEALSIGACHDLLRATTPDASYQTLCTRLGISRTRAFEGAKIAQKITEEVLREAGFVLSDGSLDEERIARLKKEALLDAASAPSRRLMLECLRNGVITSRNEDVGTPTSGTQRGVKKARGAQGRRAARDILGGGQGKQVASDEYDRLRSRGGFRMRFKGKPADFDPLEAEDKLDVLIPAAVLLAEQVLTSGEHGGQRYLLVDHTVAVSLLFPKNVSALSQSEFEKLLQKLEQLHRGEELSE